MSLISNTIIITEYIDKHLKFNHKLDKFYYYKIFFNNSKDAEKYFKLTTHKNHITSMFRFL